MQCTLFGTQVARYTWYLVPGRYPPGTYLVPGRYLLGTWTTLVATLSSTDNNAPFSHPALVGPRPGEVRKGESLRDRAQEEKQDVGLHHRTLRHGKHHLPHQLHHHLHHHHHHLHHQQEVSSHHRHGNHHHHQVPTCNALARKPDKLTILR